MSGPMPERSANPIRRATRRPSACQPEWRHGDTCPVTDTRRSMGTQSRHQAFRPANGRSCRTVMFPAVSLVAVAVVFGVLVAMTAFGVKRLEATHPPAGQFIEVEGARLHVAELGLTRGSPGAEPAVVLIHGASGNMEDMRLALGEKLANTHRVILLDRPGLGWSSRPPGDAYASPARQAELVAEALTQLEVK